MTTSEARNLAEAFEQAALAQPERPAVIGPDGALSMAEVRAGAARVARRLAEAGVRPGDAVALLFSSAVAYHVAVHAVLRAGALVVPVNPMLREELRALLANAGAVLVLAERALADEVAPRLPDVRFLRWEELAGPGGGARRPPVRPRPRP